MGSNLHMFPICKITCGKPMAYVSIFLIGKNLVDLLEQQAGLD